MPGYWILLRLRIEMILKKLWQLKIITALNYFIHIKIFIVKPLKLWMNLKYISYNSIDYNNIGYMLYLP